MLNLIQHGTESYHETVALRSAILRKPLGMQFSPEELDDEKDSFHLACWRGESVVACLILKPVSVKQMRIRQFAVHADFQRQGIGSALARHAEAFAKEKGCEETVLHARETALGFYENLGYVAEGDRFIEVTIPYFGMRKLLVAGT
jgi:ribosomal protein S18 acetylase RimI-like enzyme